MILTHPRSWQESLSDKHSILPTQRGSIPWTADYGMFCLAFFVRDCSRSRSNKASLPLRIERFPSHTFIFPVFFLCACAHCLRRARTPLTFLFSDTQIISESFVEDINNMLNSGEVPNIFPNDERVAICEVQYCKGRSWQYGGDTIEEEKSLTADTNILRLFFVPPVSGGLRFYLGKFNHLVGASVWQRTACVVRGRYLDT